MREWLLTPLTIPIHIGQYKTMATDDLRYALFNYFFQADERQPVSENRKAAFAKWAEWEKANPEKIKAKAPEKK
ncbi:MAG: hypothetical protein MUF18_01330 [Fimbriiglobus sp.]|nr:hypothetical protein [Fimbriiglobus sp.]